MVEIALLRDPDVSDVLVTIPQREIQQALRQIRFWQLAKRTAVRAEIARTALHVETEAKRLAPVDTGRLRASVVSEFRRDGLGATVGTNVQYAAFVEFGTRNQVPQPFLGPAYNKYVPQLPGRLRTILKK